MNILHLVDHLNKNCGMSNSTLNMARMTAKSLHKVYLYTGQGSAVSSFDEQSIDLIYDHGFSKSKGFINSIRLLITLYKIIKMHKIDVVHCHHRYLGFLCYILSKWLHFKLVHSDHNILRGFRKISFNGGDVIADSYANLKHIHEYFGVPTERIFVIPAFLDLSRFKSKAVLKPDVDHFIAVGRLEDQKDHITLIKAFAKFVHFHPTKKLSIIGEGSLNKDLITLINDLKLESHISIEKPSEYLENYFSRADAYVLSSKFEGTSIVTVEAVTFGLPIISTAVGGVTDYLNNRNALLVDRVKNVESMLIALQRMNSMNVNERREMVEKCNEKVSEVFNLSEQTSALMKVYRRR